ncbi:alpha/beta hydrolase [Pseudomonas sp. GD03860]|uniref:alpha/beta fold hydrolase n=1 Tax=Pseudomonas TaxID=286 RepID=UPI002363B252|nr:MULTISPECIES: alpha/beta hydrolase [Pseudomonas]MDD2058436.1 alpha/beta hydrolase [Pseudomonas putida]MDH0640248.1 alpha/beta hydrolase [Pseudomonas sp. GD03860]
MTLFTHYLDGDHVTLCADVGGNPKAPAVVFLHGGGQTRHSWSKAARSLVDQDYHCLALDLRGHGDSKWAENGDYKVDAFIADLKAVISTLHHLPVLVGASLGGATCLLAVGESSEPLAKALVLVDVVPRMVPVGIRHIHDFMRGNPQGFATLEDAADAVAAYIPDRPRPSSPQGLLKNLRLKGDGRYHWHWDPQFQNDRSRTDMGELTIRMENAARHVHIPTLLVRGKQSEVVSQEGVQHLLELIPHAQYVDVEGAGHMVAGDRNDVFNQAIEGFLRGF